MCTSIGSGKRAVIAGAILSILLAHVRAADAQDARAEALPDDVGDTLSEWFDSQLPALTRCARPEGGALAWLRMTRRDALSVERLLPAPAEVAEWDECVRLILRAHDDRRRYDAYVTIVCLRQSPCSAFQYPADALPHRAVAWIVEEQLSAFEPAFHECPARHGTHTAQLLVMLERPFDRSLRARYIEAVTSYPEGDAERDNGRCYAERVAAVRDRIRLPPGHRLETAPVLKVQFGPSVFPHPPRVVVWSPRDLATRGVRAPE